ncbi:MAG: hypothetical protein V4510_06735 [bacterium]
MLRTLTMTSLLTTALLAFGAPATDAALPGCYQTLDSPTSHYWCEAPGQRLDCYRQTDGHYECLMTGGVRGEAVMCRAGTDVPPDSIVCRVNNAWVTCVRMGPAFYFCEIF